MRGTKRAPRIDESPSAGREAALAIIDSALSSCAHRSCVTRREAAETVTRVRDAVEDPVFGAMAASIADDAMLALRDDELVDRWQLIDPLLDIRRILGS